MSIRFNLGILFAGMVLAIQLTRASENTVHSAVAALPQGTTLAANLVFNHKWYGLSNTEITCLNAILAKEPWIPNDPPGLLGNPARLAYTIILWGKDGDKLVLQDTVGVSLDVMLFHSAKTGKDYSPAVIEKGKPVTATKERKPLADLMERIEKGLEQPLAVEKS